MRGLPRRSWWHSAATHRFDSANKESPTSCHIRVRSLTMPALFLPARCRSSAAVTPRWPCASLAAVLLIHGWPFSGITWRHVVPHLQAHFRCVVVDLPGAGASRWGPQTGFSLPDHAAVLAHLLQTLGVARCAVVAHDTGATVARLLAAADGQRVAGLVLANTEAPGHRPPWIGTYKATTGLPGIHAVWRAVLGLPAFRRSTMGFGGCFWDAQLIEQELMPLHIQPLVASSHVLQGQLNYLRGVDWSVVDNLAQTHQRIRAPVRLIWGANDVTFPLAQAERMAPTFPNFDGLYPLQHARFLAHEEHGATFAQLAAPLLHACLGATTAGVATPVA